MTPAQAQHELRGELGANLVVVDFQNQLAGQEVLYAVRRGISDQFLSLGLRGPLYNPALGSYSLRTRLAGQYYQVDATSGDGAEYATPKPTALAASVGLFPGRRHPVRIYYAWSDLMALNYEQENRAVDDVANPELAAVRRYESSNLSFGTDMRYGITPTADVVVEAQHQEATSLRQYDFDEQRDIFVNFVTPSPDPTRPLVNIIVQNGIPEGDVTLLVDGIIVTTLVPDQQFVFELESGPHDVEFVPSSFNRFFAVVDVNGDMLWEASFNEPPGRTDVERSENAGRAEWVVGRQRRFENKARLTYSDAFESIQGRNNLLIDATNDAAFDWTSQAKLLSSTKFSLSESDMQSSNDQSVQNLGQRTRIAYVTLKGGTAEAEHAFDRTSTVTGPIEITTDQNRVLVNAGRPWGPYQHRVRVRNTLTHVSNSEAYRSLENRAELINDAAFFLRRARLAPRNSLGYTYTDRKNPDAGSEELDWRPKLDFTVPGLWVLGDLTGYGEYGWRRRSQEGRIDTTVRFGWSATLRRNFGPNYRLFIMTTSNRENYDSRYTVDVGEPPAPREPQRQLVYNAGFRAQPVPSIGMSFSYGKTISVDQEQGRIRADVTVRIPWINLPVSSAYSRQNRMITGLSDQTTTRWETGFVFRVRDVRIQFEHAYVAEALFSEDYALHTFSAEIARGFTVF
jgi:hypothetical protein